MGENLQQGGRYRSRLWRRRGRTRPAGCFDDEVAVTCEVEGGLEKLGTWERHVAAEHWIETIEKELKEGGKCDLENWVQVSVGWY